MLWEESRNTVVKKRKEKYRNKKREFIQLGIYLKDRLYKFFNFNCLSLTNGSFVFFCFVFPIYKNFKESPRFT